MSVLHSSSEAIDFHSQSDVKHANRAPHRPGPEPTWSDRQLRRLLLTRLKHLRVGRLELADATGLSVFEGEREALQPVRLTVTDPRAFRLIAFGGSLGAAEAYLRGYWEADDLLAALRLFVQNASVLSSLDRGPARLFQPARGLWRWLRRNTRTGSRRNIAAHYDLSNEFFALMLDPTMTYSSGIFEAPDASLEQASRSKYDRMCRLLQLSSRDHVLEIGTGWGGFAMYAASQYGCRVTTTTISEQQFGEAERRVTAAGLNQRVELKQVDYRDLQGTYDKLVSIEMIEAVGESMLPTFFQQCARLLKPHGLFALQAITMADCRYDAYRRSVDFINRHIFPGGFLPSWSAMFAAVRQHTDFQLVEQADFAEHYAHTLARWREKFWSHIADVRRLGFDERFVRMWDYYLCYCQAGFLERQIGLSQALFAKEDWRPNGLTIG